MGGGERRGCEFGEGLREDGGGMVAVLQVVHVGSTFVCDISSWMEGSKMFFGGMLSG